VWKVLKIWFLAWLVATCVHIGVSTGATFAFGPYSDTTAAISMIAGFLIVGATFACLLRRYRQMWRVREAAVAA
jgi:hypothetical protein